MANIRFFPVGKGQSLFSFIKDHCLGEGSGLSHNSAFHRLCSLMRKMDVKTAVVEDLPDSHSEIEIEHKALNTFFRQPIEFRLHRTTFISEEITAFDDLFKVRNNSFLASAIIINYKHPGKGWASYLFSAIVAIPYLRNHPKYGDIPILNNYIHIFKTFKREISSSDKLFAFEITGTFFCQQNSVTSVCAHASLCMILNNYTPALSADLISAEHINSIIGVNHTDKTVGGHKPSVAFTNDKIKAVISKYGLTYELLDFFENPNTEYNDVLYKYVESRCPVLLVFKTDFSISHVVPIIGHTLNSDMWKPEAEPAYSPSSRLEFVKSASAWVDHFIIHDDNFGMYFCLPVDALKRVTLPKYDPTFRAHYAVVIKPSDVTTPPREAEWASSVVIADMLQYVFEWHKKAGIPLDIWIEMLIKRFIKHKPIVIRTLLCTKEDYEKSLEIADFSGNSFSPRDKEELTTSLPKRFWLSEITLPDLYTANKHKIIDFFYGSDYLPLIDQNEIKNRWLQIRLPFILIKRNPGCPPSIVETSVKSHYPLLSFERDHDVLEW